MSNEIKIGDKVKDSGVGAGEITSFTDRGYPRVNEVACAWIVFEDGSVFDPHDHFKKYPS